MSNPPRLRDFPGFGGPAVAFRASRPGARDRAGAERELGRAVPSRRRERPLGAALFRRVVEAAGLDPTAWTPRELRHSFVSLLSDAGVPTEKIAQLVGHSSTVTTERVYRHQIRPVVQGGAQVMDGLFTKPGDQDA